MAKEDQEKTIFIIDTGLYYYNIMPFGLKNARATYQRLMNKVLTELIRKTMEVYVDDMITKSVTEVDYVRDLEETLRILRHYGMKPNPKK